MSFLRHNSVLFTRASRHYTSCNRKCIENNNVFSTTTKVTFFNLLFNVLFTGYLSNCLIQMNYNQHNIEERLNKKLDAEFSKLNNHIIKLDTEL